MNAHPRSVEDSSDCGKLKGFEPQFLPQLPMNVRMSYRITEISRDAARRSVPARMMAAA
jgi:hypothetical protein